MAAFDHYLIRCISTEDDPMDGTIQISPADPQITRKHPLDVEQGIFPIPRYRPAPDPEWLAINRVALVRALGDLPIWSSGTLKLARHPIRRRLSSDTDMPYIVHLEVSYCWASIFSNTKKRRKSRSEAIKYARKEYAASVKRYVCESASNSPENADQKIKGCRVSKTINGNWELELIEGLTIEGPEAEASIEAGLTTPRSHPPSKLSIKRLSLKSKLNTITFEPESVVSLKKAVEIRRLDPRPTLITVQAVAIIDHDYLSVSDSDSEHEERGSCTPANNEVALSELITFEDTPEIRLDTHLYLTNWPPPSTEPLYNQSCFAESETQTELEPEPEPEPKAAYAGPSFPTDGSHPHPLRSHPTHPPQPAKVRTPPTTATLRKTHSNASLHSNRKAFVMQHNSSNFSIDSLGKVTDTSDILSKRDASTSTMQDSLLSQTVLRPKRMNAVRHIRASHSRSNSPGASMHDTKISPCAPIPRQLPQKCLALPTSTLRALRRRSAYRVLGTLTPVSETFEKLSSRRPSEKSQKGSIDDRQPSMIERRGSALSGLSMKSGSTAWSEISAVGATTGRTAEGKTGKSAKRRGFQGAIVGRGRVRFTLYKNVIEGDFRYGRRGIRKQHLIGRYL